MNDDLVKRLQTSGDVLRHIEAQAAEIARLRAALATARLEGMEIPSEFWEWMKREMPSGTNIHNPDWWAERIWKAAIRAAAKEGKP